MNLRERNRAIVRLTADVAHFDTDRELLASITPMHPSVTEQTNRFTKPRVHAKIICELLNHVSPEDVFKNRFPKLATPNVHQQPEPPADDEHQEPPNEDQQPEPPADDVQQDPPKEDQQPEPPAPSKKKVNTKSSPE